MAGTVTMALNLTGLSVGTVQLTLSITPNANNNFQVQTPTLASGFNSITVPSWAVGVLIEPSAANTQTLTLKGVTGDTGIALSETNPSMFTFQTPPSTIGLTAGGNFSTLTTITFW